MIFFEVINHWKCTSTGSIKSGKAVALIYGIFGKTLVAFIEWQDETS